MSSIDTAFNFYSKHIYNQEKMNLLRQHGLPIAGSVPSVSWELFGALLTGRDGTGAIGADLQGWEVKSASGSGSYEYQYHLNTGMVKLTEDCSVNHLFCSYSNEYKNVTVKVIEGSELANKYFKKWIPEYVSNYANKNDALRRQRFRKSIPFAFVQLNGTPILEIDNAILTFRDDHQIDRFNERT